VIACLPGATLATITLGSSRPLPLAHATALVFVAYTGYGRIATLGEEVREPSRTIPRAIVITLAITLALYLVVTTTALARAGATALAAATHATAAPLEVIAPVKIRWVVAIGAMTAMLGVLLNLVLGISRVVLAMARRGDVPRGLARVDGDSPRIAVLATGGVIAVLALIGSVRVTWTVSACTVLLYYSVMNVCALRQPRAEQRVPRAVPALGLLACVGLAVVVVATL
jgi:APA family basic amino acid/polyamine antiporter